MTVFASAARSFAALVREIPDSRWDGPGLGEWDLRSLVGHTSRSLITVSSYLQTSASREDIATPQEYYVRVTGSALGLDPADVVQRGRQAGRDLGDDPAATIDGLVARALGDVEAADDPLIEVIGGLGIRLSTYLPTRVFELAVHGLDIARATGLDFALPDEVLDEAVTLAARIGVALGKGETVLLALTGREALPPSFSVV
ncbi:maleylpyruvate isomerase family mycothiol-dependent enzyme [Mycobacterium hubeiense]|uniref:maleylpyruvate isomerase family mycothiol-dependent enzyme n=1 Tax=Mycobacterium hubeiense TaxID=1867256 RepID=UPI001E32E406|nr:maleylpyruvate isomerase N-terminal domain-containing protein [Mycobacterium sp. QGD 101]